MEFPKRNQISFGTRSVGNYGTKIWNALPYHMKTSKRFSKPLSNIGIATIILTKSANIQLQDNKISQEQKHFIMMKFNSV